MSIIAGQLAQHSRARLLHGLSSLTRCSNIPTGTRNHQATENIFLLSLEYQARSKSMLSRREIASLEDDLTKAVGQLKDPILSKDLKTLGWLPKRLVVRDDRESVSLEIQLPSLLHPALDDLKFQIRSIADDLLRNHCKVDIEVQTSKPYPIYTASSDQRTEYLKQLGPGLANVSHCIAVYSCKGGVGKSTLAVNLAYELARIGGRVGLLDVDIYGPSLPILVKPDDATVRQSAIGPGMVKPIEHHGVKLLSLGYVSPDSGVPGSGDRGGAAVMRGPMAGRVVTQLLKGTEWGDLDVLVLDLPPGTGDVQLAICQDLRLTGAIAVTTPSKLALADARKGMEMFTSLGVPTLAVVENMSYFVCDGGGKHFPFGKAALEEESKNVFRLPISTITNESNDNGIPLALARPGDAAEELSAIECLAVAVSRELLIAQHGLHSAESSREGSSPTHRVFFPETNSDDEFDIASTHVTLSEDGFRARFYSDKGAMQITIPPAVLRFTHPKTGEKIERVENDAMVQQSASDNQLLPAVLEAKGRYGYSVQWKDGATIIYSMLSIAKAAGGVAVSA